MSGPPPTSITPPVLSAALLETLVETAPVAMVLSDQNRGIRWLNREAEALFGYARHELIGQPVETLIPLPARARHMELRRDFFTEPNARRMGVGRELFGLHRDGSQVPIEIGLTPIVSADGLFVLSVIGDIRERKRLEADVRHANELLEQRVRERTAELEATNRYKELLLADLQTQREELDRLSREDPLTGLANRREFDQRLDDEIRRAQRQGTPLAVAMLDLDRFKNVNDRFGHALGDAVLREVGDLIRRECRAIDIIGRYGGEEFALALPGTDLHAGATLCERIRVAFERCDWQQLHPDLAVTVSAGVSVWSPGADAQTLLAAADANLYEAKRSGRNRVVPAA